MSKVVDIIMPENEHEGTESFVENWFKRPGDPVEKHEPLLEINTDKVTMEVASPTTGVLKEMLKGPNDPVAAGDILGRITEEGEESAHDQPPQMNQSEKSEENKPATNGEKIRSSPIVRRLMQEHGLSPQDVPGSGRGGRITIRDVETKIAAMALTTAAPSTIATSGPAASRFVSHSPTRKATARHMVHSMLQTAPHVTALFDADMGAVIAHREKHKSEYASRNIKLTFTPYFIDAAVKALQAVPEVNSRWHEDQLEIFHDCNIGVAAATKQGLIVPVIHQAQRKSLFAIAESMQNLTIRARGGKLKKNDLQNGTFTITNHGMTGSLLATPIINQPQSAILGIGKLEKRVVVSEENGRDRMEIRPMVYVTLTIDHRALDGFQANSFLTRFVAALQEWH